jgi:hypothetical protein
LTAQVECPHCQVINIVPNVEQWPTYHIRTCENDVIGCGEPFAIRTFVQVHAEVYTLTKWEQKP